MPISAKRKLVVGATGLAVLAGSGGAIAAAQSSSPTPSPTTTKPAARADLGAEQKAFLDDVAKRLNVTRDQLDAAIKGAAEARIDAAVAAGKLTKEQGEEAKKRLDAGAPFFGLGPVPGGPPRGGAFGPRGHGHFGVGLDEAAKYLGLTEAQLRERLRDGKSLADVAKEQKKSVDGLKSALKDALTARLDEAVKDKRLTEAEKNRILRNIDDRLDAIVNGKRPDGPPGPFKRRWR
jgi:hypothetical protein